MRDVAWLMSRQIGGARANTMTCRPLDHAPVYSQGEQSERVAVSAEKGDDMAEFAASLERYMDVILRVGVNLQRTQPVTIGGGRGVPIEFADIVRLLTRRAYDLGASSVKVTWSDPAVDRMWFERASTEALQT